MSSPIDTLSTALCPWLRDAFDRLEGAHRQGRLGHAWLIAGPSGLGKINLALALAQRVLGSLAAPAELGAAAALEALAERHAPVDRHPDLHWLHPEEDKESISVEQVRGVIEALGLTAHRGAAKVVIVEPAEAMTAAAANALLKTLEEPTRDSYLLLVSHRPGRLPATVRSRCQRLELRPPPASAVAAWLGASPEAVVEASRLTGGAPLAVATELRTKTTQIKELERLVSDVCEDKIDCQSLAQMWAKEGAEPPLTWLSRRLYEELRFRADRGLSTGVTVPPSPTLHNAWRGIGSRTLFEQYDRAQKLLNLLGSGVNMDLALQALLSAFQVNRGRTS
jgi:DNA polymerase-3 subunit delta'